MSCCLNAVDATTHTSETDSTTSVTGTDDKRLRATGPTGGTLSANSKHVTEALAAGAWEAALDLLVEMRAKQQVPKLGSVQRWVRVCDAAEHNSTGQPCYRVPSTVHPP